MKQRKNCKFWWFLDFLHRFKKILEINLKNLNVTVLLGSSSFKWAQTQLCRPSGYGAYWLFVQYSRVLRYRPVKPSSDQLRGAHIAQPLLMKSRVLLRSGTRHTRFLSTTWVGKALDSFHRKKEYIWPFPHPFPPL